MTAAPGMVERVSAAMEVRRRELLHAPLARIWDELARAAIEVMREPTDAMVMQGCIMSGPDSGWGATVLAWQAMIDAALSEGSK